MSLVEKRIIITKRKKKIEQLDDFSEIKCTWWEPHSQCFLLQLSSETLNQQIFEKDNICSYHGNVLDKCRLTIY